MNACEVKNASLIRVRMSGPVSWSALGILNIGQHIDERFDGGSVIGIAMRDKFLQSVITGFPLFVICRS